jgi:uncharacterized Ntn-hydrolase superfamily protein
MTAPRSAVQKELQKGLQKDCKTDRPPPGFPPVFRLQVVPEAVEARSTDGIGLKRKCASLARTSVPCSLRGPVRFSLLFDPMTWSIVARDASGALGVAVASRFFAVGVHCPHARSGVGAVSTQALVNPHYGPTALDFLQRNIDPEQAVRDIVGKDDGRDHRQLHMIDAKGRTAAHTGAACIDWCGHIAGEGFSVAGNMLTGPQVLEKTVREFQKQSDAPFAERLIAALTAGEAAGGDKRGKQAAALLIHTTESYPFLDLRVDDHPEPLVELRRLYERSLERYQPFMACLPSAARPAGITDRAVIEKEIQRFQQRHGKS